MSGYEAPALFGCPGESIYLLLCQGQAVVRLGHAVHGRVVRSLVPVSPAADERGALHAALGRAAAGDIGADVRLPCLSDFGAMEDLFVVSIRPEDRERFEETMGGAPRRYIGRTSQEPGLRID